MLATPGRSPRHLPPPPSPSPSTASDATVSARSASGRALMGPPLPKRMRRPEVLDEDTYVAAIEKIVMRDFFPDIPKLQNRLEWLEAVRSGDPVVIRATQMRIIERRAKSAREAREMTPSIAGTPATELRTPKSALVGASPAASFRSDDIGPGFGEEAGEQAGLRPDTSLSLDKFLWKYTSEDNASFGVIKAGDDKKRRAAAERQLSKDQVQESLILSAAGDGQVGERKSDGYGSTGQPTSTLVSWDYKGRSLLMYDSSNRASAPLTQQEINERAKGPPKEVSAVNTRFHGKMFNGKQNDEETVAILYTPVPGATPVPFAERDAARARQHYDLEDLRRTPAKGGEGGGEGGGEAGQSYGLVMTPSPRPGVGESPFMTWGDIEGTPVRLEAEDMPVGLGLSDGPLFKIPSQLPRDEAARIMSRSAGKRLRERTKAQGLGFASPMGGRLGYSPAGVVGGSSRVKGGAGAGGSLTPSGIDGLSTAARKLVSHALRVSHAGRDPNLRASYGGQTPGRSPGPARPSRSPSVGRSQSLAKGTPPLPAVRK